MENQPYYEVIIIRKSFSFCLYFSKNWFYIHYSFKHLTLCYGKEKNCKWIFRISCISHIPGEFFPCPHNLWLGCAAWNSEWRTRIRTVYCNPSDWFSLLKINENLFTVRKIKKSKQQGQEMQEARFKEDVRNWRRGTCVVAQWLGLCFQCRGWRFNPWLGS